MGLLKKSGVSLLGWLAWVVLNYSFNFLLYNPLYKWIWQIKDGYQVDDLVLAAILFPVSFILNFIGFAISFRIVIFPIARRSNLTIGTSKGSLFFEWVLFYIVFTVLCLPITAVQWLLSLIPVSDTVIHAITPIWQVLVSFGLYRENVLDHLKKSPDQLESTKIQITGFVDTIE